MCTYTIIRPNDIPNYVWKNNSDLICTVLSSSFNSQFFSPVLYQHRIIVDIYIVYRHPNRNSLHAKNFSFDPKLQTMWFQPYFLQCLLIPIILTSSVCNDIYVYISSKKFFNRLLLFFVRLLIYIQSKFTFPPVAQRGMVCIPRNIYVVVLYKHRLSESYDRSIRNFYAFLRIFIYRSLNFATQARFGKLAALRAIIY